MRMNSSYLFILTALAILVLGSFSAQAQTSITSTPASQVGTNQTINFTYTVTGFTATVTYSLTGNLPPRTHSFDRRRYHRHAFLHRYR